MFNSKFPIIALPMVHISDIDFAIACADAGIYPSVIINEYYDHNYKIQYQKLMDDLVKFKQATGHLEILFHIHTTELHNTVFLTVLRRAGIKFLEIVMPFENDDAVAFKESLEYAKRMGFICFQRVNEYDKNSDVKSRNGYWFPNFDGMIIKGNRGAGAAWSHTTSELFGMIQHDWQIRYLVVAGGISSKKQVDHYLNCGAVAVGIGTLFAVSKEAKISEATKRLMVEANFASVQKNTYPNRNSLVFRPIPIKDPNHIASAKLGVKRPEIGGHIDCGAAVDHITEILSLKEIVSNLVS